MIEPAIRYFEVHPIVASADCETRMQIPARIGTTRYGLVKMWGTSIGRYTQSKGYEARINRN